MCFKCIFRRSAWLHCTRKYIVNTGYYKEVYYSSTWSSWRWYICTVHWRLRLKFCSDWTWKEFSMRQRRAYTWTDVNLLRAAKVEAIMMKCFNLNQNLALKPKLYGSTLWTCKHAGTKRGFEISPRCHTHRLCTSISCSWHLHSQHFGWSRPINTGCKKTLDRIN